MPLLLDTDIATVYTGIIVVILTIINMRIAHSNKLNDIANRNTDFILEVDKLMLSNPELWAIYNEYESSVKSKFSEEENKLLTEKIRSYSYFVINGYGMIYKSSDSKNKKFWENYIKELLALSTEFKDIVSKEIDKNKDERIYPHGYLDQLERLKPKDKTIK